MVHLRWVTLGLGWNCDSKQEQVQEESPGYSNSIVNDTNSVSKKEEKNTRANIKHKKQRRKSKIIVEDYDSKKVTVITDLVSDTHDDYIESDEED